MHEVYGYICIIYEERSIVSYKKNDLFSISRKRIQQIPLLKGYCHHLCENELFKKITRISVKQGSSTYRVNIARVNTLQYLIFRKFISFYGIIWHSNSSVFFQKYMKFSLAVLLPRPSVQYPQTKIFVSDPGGGEEGKGGGDNFTYIMCWFEH